MAGRAGRVLRAAARGAAEDRRTDRATPHLPRFAGDNIRSLSSLCTPEKCIVIWIGKHNWLSFLRLEDGSQVHSVADQFRWCEAELIQPKLDPLVR